MCYEGMREEERIYPSVSVTGDLKKNIRLPASDTTCP